MIGALLLGSACSSDNNGAVEDTDASDTERGDTQGDTDGGEPLPEGQARVVHSFGSYDLAPLEEVQPCIQWTLDNEKPVYVNEVTMTNAGGFHHSNWIVVPEDLYEGPDGFFDCSERGYTELEAAVSGTVLWAQSTQSRIDGMTLPEGVVVKIPPRHKIMAGGHLLNLANAPFTTEARMSLRIIHPEQVKTVVSAFRLSYLDLEIAARAESHFTATCDLNTTYEQQVKKPLDLKLYYIMPHYHYLGNFFDLSISGGPRDGESVFRLEGFNADNNGQVMDPPLDLTGAEGFTFTCGYDNWRDKEIGWGIGDQEMCVMLGLADSAVMMDASVISGNQIVGVDGEIQLNEGPCTVLGLPKNDSQTMPTQEEIDGELYIPPTDPGDAELPPVPPCEDTPTDATPAMEPTLSNIADTLFVSSCQFSACHQRETAVAGLDLAAENLHEVLMNHSVQANTDMPLVAPGDPEGSWLYHLISRCEPTDKGGNPVRTMPLNAPFLSDPGLVAMVRDWIAAGAPND